MLDPKYLRNTFSDDVVMLDSVSLASTKERNEINQGIIFDKDLSFGSQIKLILRSAIFH